jgi:D-glycero-alpha-D-manno-heptose-7-phosphate kinase
MIIVQSPLRISLFGGGTDLPDFYLKEGGCVLSSTTDKSIFVTVKRRFDRLLRVGYTRTELVETVDEIEHELIREALRKTGIKEGVEVTTMGDIPSEGSGLGSSSTVTVGALHALYTFLGKNVSAERLAQEACEIEIEILGKPTGVQDQYIAAFGGLRFMEFLPSGEIAVHRISIGPNEIRKLANSLMLFFTGINRKSETILSEQVTNISKRIDVLNEMKKLAYLARERLETGNFDELGDMMHYNWNLKKRLASTISNPIIDELYARARAAGALGGKITGAGGGGFLLLYCPHENQDSVRYALRDLHELPFSLGPDGAKVIFNYRRGPVNDIPAETADLSATIRTSALKHPATIQKEETPAAPIMTGYQWQDEYVSGIVESLSSLSSGSIQEVIHILHNTRLAKRKVFILGNGGSAATASHFACDLSKNTKTDALPDFRVIGLTDNVSLLTALANDEGYESVFVQQLAPLLKPGDTVIAISASGNSKNVLEAVRFAKQSGAMTIGFTGFDGGELGRISDFQIHVPSYCIEHVEDAHLMLEHMITKALREEVAFPQQEVEEYAALSDDSISFKLINDRESLELIYAINRKLAENGDSAQYLEDLLQVTLEKIGAASGSVYLLDAQGNFIAGAVAFEGQVRSLPPDEKFDILEKGLAAWVLDTRTPAIVSSTHNDPRWLRRNWTESKGLPRSAICVPLDFNGNMSGVLTLVKSGAETFDRHNLEVLSAIAVSASLYNAHVTR